MQRPSIFGNLKCCVPMLVHQDRGQFIHFLIGHPLV